MKNRWIKIPVEWEKRRQGISRWSSLGFNFLDGDDQAVKLAGTTEPAEDESFTPKTLSFFLNTNRKVSESSSPGKIETTAKKLLTESPRRRKIQNANPSTFS